MKYTVIIGIILLANIGHLFAQTTKKQSPNNLAPKIIYFKANCPSPSKAKCAIKNPIISGYTVLSEQIEIDRDEYNLIIDFRKRNPGNNDQVRILASSGEEYVFNITFPSDPVLTINKNSNSESEIKKNNSTESTAAPLEKSSASPSSKKNNLNNEEIQKPQSTNQIATTKNSNKAQIEKPVNGTATPVNTNSTSKDSLPCITEACIGDEIDSIKAVLMNNPNLSEILSRNVNLDKQKKITDGEFNGLIGRSILIFQTGNMENFEESINNITEKLDDNNKTNIIKNARMMALAFLVAKNSTPNATPKNISELARYLVPVTTVEIEYFHNQVRMFDFEFTKLIIKINPIFCYPYQMTGAFKSKSGYLTRIHIQPDLDGKFRITSINRLFEIKDSDARQELRKQLAESYMEFSVKNELGLMLVDIDGAARFFRERVDPRKQNVDLTLRHPMQLLTNENYDKDNIARWTKGWLSLKKQGKAIPLARVFKNQKECKSPQAPVE
jgi:hypothetical protein